MYIDSESLVALPTNVLQPLGGSLDNLDMHNNGLTSLEPGVLNGLENLERLDLYGNRITVLEADVFAETPLLVVDAENLQTI